MKRGAWWAIAYLLLLLGLAFHEGLTGSAGIDALTRAPLREPLLEAPGPRPTVLEFIDNSPECYDAPSNEVAATALRRGELPLWNEHLGLGLPLLANGQAMPLSPLKLPFLLGFGTTGAAAAWCLVLRLFVFGTGGILLAGALGLGLPGSALAGAVMALNAFSTYRFHYSDVTAYALMPWVLWCGLRLGEAPGPRRMAWLGLAIGVAGIVGHPEPALFAAGVAWLVTLGKGHWRWHLGAAMLGAGLAAFTVLPFLDYVRGCGGYHLARQVAVGVVHPGYWGMLRVLLRHLLFLENDFGLHAYNTWVGVGALLLACLGAGHARVRPIALGVLGCALLLGLTMPPDNLFDVLPVAPNGWYLSGLGVVGLALLAGAGLERFLLFPRAAAWPLAGLAVVVMGLVGAERLLQPAFVRHLSWSWQSAAAAGAVLVLALAARRLPATALAAGVALLVGTELVVVARLAVPRMAPFLYPRPPVVEALVKMPGTFRLAGFTPNLYAGYGLDGLDVLDPFLPRRYLAFMRAVNSGYEDRNATTVYVHEGFQRDLLDLANVRYLTVAADSAIAGRMLALPGFRVVMKQHGSLLVENQQALPRAWVSHQAAFTTERQAEATLRGTPAAWRTRALVETPDGRPLPGWRDGGPPSPATVTVRGNRDVEVTLAPGPAGLLVLADAYDAGWQATVDGRPAAVRPADLDLRAVQVPAGARVVRFRYAPVWVTRGFAVSGAALLLCLVLLLLPARQAMRETTTT